MATKKQRPVLLAVVSDVHAGSAVALCPDTISLDDGGEYHASKAQRWLFQCWRSYWAAVEAKRDALELLQAQGRLHVHRVMRLALDGRRAMVAGYTITPLAKPKGKR